MKTKRINWEAINWGAIIISLEILVVLGFCGREIYQMSTIGWQADPIPLGNIWMIGGAIIFLPLIIIGLKEGHAMAPLGLFAMWIAVGVFAVSSFTAIAAWQLGYSTSAIIQPALMGGMTTLLLFFGGGWMASQEI
ncbi:MAG: hypothetical protein IJ870_01400 [Alphaproteobacteria bacterium]|nr:hypothetical protein [Alphaproteobacteria bacterium]